MLLPATAASAATGRGGSPAGPAWTFDPGGTPQAAQVYLSGVNCPAANYCIAVGDFVNSVGNDHALAMRWNGTKWAVQRMYAPAGAQARAISCLSANDCTAVGYYPASPTTTMPFADSWNGQSWQPARLRGPAGASGAYLIGVSCPSAARCVAVGDYTTGAGSQETLSPLAEVWNGRAWQISATAPVPPHSADALYSVSCVSTTTCTAVGENGGASPLIESWNGTSWVIDPAPASGSGPLTSLSEISCPGRDSCEAVGSGAASPLVYAWNGTKWLIQPTPATTPDGSTPLQLTGVSCPAADACTAVGEASGPKAGPGGDFPNLPLIENWSGSKWTTTKSPSPSATGMSDLQDVSCFSASACAAIGSTSSTKIEVLRGFAEIASGSGWQLAATPNPPGAYPSALGGVSCRTSGCMAVGGSIWTLAERQVGSSWHVLPTPVPAYAMQASLSSVSCVTAASCMAIGTYVKRTGTFTLAYEPLAEVWNGTAWRSLAVPQPSGSLGSQLSGVSCASAVDCVAVGFWLKPNGQSALALGLIETWNGKVWTASAPPPPPGSQSILTSVSCPTTSFCAAAGAVAAKVGILPFVSTWNGKNWTVQETPSPSGGKRVELFGISCATAQSCAAVGGYRDQSGAYLELAETWAGKTWSLDASATGTSGTLFGVSCPNSSSCVAVGTMGVNHPRAVIKGWDGTSWRSQSAATVPGSKGGELVSVSCVSATECTAVGASLTDGGSGVSLVESS
jgi:hypothetical protein